MKTGIGASLMYAFMCMYTYTYVCRYPCDVCKQNLAAYNDCNGVDC